MREYRISHLVFAWIALLALLGLTLGSAYLPMGAANTALNYAIALAKAAIVMVVFMHAARGDGFVRVLALAGLVWLLMLGALGLADYATRAPANGSQTERPPRSGQPAVRIE
jgi:cytochrome c oxidase subunit 4